MKYANVIIDNKSNSTDVPYTYGYDESLKLRIGSKVKVPFARSKQLRDGYVISTQEKVDENIASKIKEIDSVDPDVSLSEEMMRTCEWMRQRYVCRYIDAINCFTPAGKKPTRKITPDPIDEKEEGANELTKEQRDILVKIERSISENRGKRFLLRGVTGSGKTEVYIRAAKKAIQMNRKAIILVPEISLTPQTIRRFNGVFGPDKIAVLHSKMTLAQRYDQWKKIRTGNTDIVIGARSAIFAPLEDIGLIVVDEEHESTYKSDYTPKYDAIEVAIKRAADRDNNGIILLGSATPSVANYYRAHQGIYDILSMKKRYNETPLPRVQMADMRDELKNGNRSVLSSKLYEEMNSCLDDGMQVMLFLNRRGYSTFISCRECGYVARCPICGLSLTYHSSNGSLNCHYCGYREPMPKTCSQCSSKYIRHFGSGTEKIEEAIRERFPRQVIDRVDLDSIRKKGELKRRLKAFEKGDTDILVGTQIIAKGLDFRNVGLVGIISADVMLNIPDYRSSERTFQLITQASGRAGRGTRVGKVVIQTYNPDHYAVRFASMQDYDGFYREEIDFRKAMRYPPFSDMIQILFTSEDPNAAEKGAYTWYEELIRVLSEAEGKDVFRPQQAYMSRIRNVYRYSLVIRCMAGNRKKYTTVLRKLKEEDTKKRAPWQAIIDVNPYSFA